MCVYIRNTSKHAFCWYAGSAVSAYTGLHRNSPRQQLRCSVPCSMHQQSWSCTNAIALQLGIVVFVQVDIVFYSKSSSTDNRHKGRDLPYIKYPRGKRRRSNATCDLLLEDLRPATCLVVYDGCGHLWAALQTGALPSEESLTARNMCLLTYLVVHVSVLWDLSWCACMGQRGDQTKLPARLHQSTWWVDFLHDAAPLHSVWTV